MLLVLVFAGNAGAVNQGSGSGVGANIQTQTADQGVANQIQTQTGVQTQNGDNNQTNNGAQIQQQPQTADQGTAEKIQTENSQQTQTGNNMPNAAQIQIQSQVREQVGQKLQDGESERQQNQNQNKNQVQNQGEENQIKPKEQEAAKMPAGGLQNAEQRRSQVANAVQQMLQMADREGGIGQQVRTIAQTQTQNQEKLETSLQKVQNRSGFAKFFIGPNYGEINNAQKLLQQNREQIASLNQIKTQLANEGDQQILAQQIQTLEQANLQIENSLNQSQKGFSLLGWMFKLFAK